MDNNKNSSSQNGTIQVLNELRATQNISSTVDKYIKTSSNNEKIIEIDVSNIIRWKFKDRPENELGDIKALAQTFQSVGQQQPCIVRPTKDNGVYELIVGERRWRAAQLLGINLRVIVKNFDDKTAALIQAIENEKRDDLSEYAKGTSYSEKISNGLITQKDLIEILGISKQQVTRLLSFSKIPQVICDKIKSFKNVTARTAYEISRMSQKGDDHINIILNLAEKINSGKIGANKLILEIEKQLSLCKNTNQIHENYKTYYNNNHLFSLSKNKENKYIIKFSDFINNHLKNNKEDCDYIINTIKETIIKKLGHESPYGDKKNLP
ncbi:MAG: ParB/RepB/Spo0J family partition protein [Candidatus Midichloriaceae bacterium]